MSYPPGKVTSRIALLCGLLSLITPGFAAQESRIRGVVKDVGTEGAGAVVLRGNVTRSALPEHDQGALDLSAPIHGMRLILGQTTEQAAALEQLLEDQRNPSSPDYQRWRTPEEYGERFGVSDNDLAQLATWLQSQGFTVEQVARAHNWIAFSGTAGQVRDAFRTELHHFEADGKKHFANATEPLIPASLAGVVDSIRGLDDFRPQPQPQTFKAIPDFNASNGFHYIGPPDLATIYDIQALYSAGFDGTGQKLAIAGQTDINLSDIRAFRAQFALPAKDPQLVLVGSDPGKSQSDRIEANLDLEWAGAVARNATIIYVYSQNVFESLEYAIDQNLAPVISVSYGGCETAATSSFRTLAQQANAEGITWLNASGDSGAAGCDNDGERAASQGPAVTFPADIPEVTAVGGSELNEGSVNYWSAAERLWTEVRPVLHPGRSLERHGPGIRTCFERRRRQHALHETVVADRPRRARRPGAGCTGCFAHRIRRPRRIRYLFRRPDLGRRDFRFVALVCRNRRHSQPISGGKRRDREAGSRQHQSIALLACRRTPQDCSTTLQRAITSFRALWAARDVVRARLAMRRDPATISLRGWVRWTLITL